MQHDVIHPSVWCVLLVSFAHQRILPPVQVDY